ncbi:MAG: deoxyuridine 5'-triphosphate nucleotidohydrolase [Lachnospiraceae bacterium]|nr:deoxyuridine 5'-triphosphate nucleotidohydrolase [Lachnospiraceae bacterium]MBQ6482754.1 hypothetical protein [Anaerolineaceae bacterium]
MQRVGKFEKLSLKQFISDFFSRFPASRVDSDISMPEMFDMINKFYDDVVLPERATGGSAGYDIHTPIGIQLDPGEDTWIPLGIKCKIEPGWFLMIVPRSGSGSKYRLRLANTAGIIDSDYYNNENNEGHIQIRICNEGDDVFDVDAGTAIAQAIFVPYGITEDDKAEGERNGGFGSTDVTTDTANINNDQ